MLLLFLWRRQLTWPVCICSEKPFCFVFEIDSSSEFGFGSSSDVFTRVWFSEMLTSEDEEWTWTVRIWFSFKLGTSRPRRIRLSSGSRLMRFMFEFESSGSFLVTKSSRLMRFSLELEPSGFRFPFLDVKDVSRVIEEGGAPFSEFVLKIWIA